MKQREITQSKFCYFVSCGLIKLCSLETQIGTKLYLVDTIDRGKIVIVDSFNINVSQNMIINGVITTQNFYSFMLF